MSLKGKAAIWTIRAVKGLFKLVPKVIVKGKSILIKAGVKAAKPIGKYLGKAITKLKLKIPALSAKWWKVGFKGWMKRIGSFIWRSIKTIYRFIRDNLVDLFLFIKDLLGGSNKDPNSPEEITEESKDLGLNSNNDKESGVRLNKYLNTQFTKLKSLNKLKSDLLNKVNIEYSNNTYLTDELNKTKVKLDNLIEERKKLLGSIIEVEESNNEDEQSIINELNSKYSKNVFTYEYNIEKYKIISSSLADSDNLINEYLSSINRLDVQVDIIKDNIEANSTESSDNLLIRYNEVEKSSNTSRSLSSIIPTLFLGLTIGVSSLINSLSKEDNNEEETTGDKSESTEDEYYNEGDTERDLTEDEIDQIEYYSDTTNWDYKNNADAIKKVGDIFEDLYGNRNIDLLVKDDDQVAEELFKAMDISDVINVDAIKAGVLAADLALLFVPGVGWVTGLLVSAAGLLTELGAEWYNSSKRKEIFIQLASKPDFKNYLKEALPQLSNEIDEAYTQYESNPGVLMRFTLMAFREAHIKELKEARRRLKSESNERDNLAHNTTQYKTEYLISELNKEPIVGGVVDNKDLRKVIKVTIGRKYYTKVRVRVGNHGEVRLYKVPYYLKFEKPDWISPESYESTKQGIISEANDQIVRIKSILPEESLNVLKESTSSTYPLKILGQPAEASTLLPDTIPYEGGPIINNLIPEILDKLIELNIERKALVTKSIIGEFQE